MSPINTPIAWAVPPAALIGPQKSIDKNSLPSTLLRILTSPIPSKGATRTASVRTARPTLSPESIDLRLSLVIENISLVTDFAIIIAAVSRSLFSSKFRRSPSIFNASWLLSSGFGNRYGFSSSFSVLLAKSAALGISIESEKSRFFDFASFAIT